MKVYLDNAASTPMDPLVLQAMNEAMESTFGNPSSIHAHGREARALIEQARKKVARLLNAAPAEIFFTSGGTEADNTALNGAVHSLGIRHVITSRIEHHAVLHTLEHLAAGGRVRLSFVKLDSFGRPDLDHLESLLGEGEKTLVSLMHANNEIGTLLDLESVSALCRQYGALFHSDTVQSIGHFPYDLSRQQLDFIVGSAHKFHGPKGVGFLYVRQGTRIAPLIHGGAQERNMRGGTENIPGIAGLSKAMELAWEEMERKKKHLRKLKSHMIERLRECVPGLEFNGPVSPEESLDSILNVSFPPSDAGEMLLFNLDIRGVSASGGSACSSGSPLGSHVLAALNVNPERASVRFSFSKYNNIAEIDYAVEKLRELMPLKV